MGMPTVAEQLRAARESKNLTIQQVAEITKIRTDHIRALEEGNFDMFVAPVYIRGFTRTYATLLKLDVPQLIKALELELGQTEKFAEPPRLSDNKKGALDFVMLQFSKVNLRRGGVVFMDAHCHEVNEYLFGPGIPVALVPICTDAPTIGPRLRANVTGKAYWVGRITDFKTEPFIAMTKALLRPGSPIKEVVVIGDGADLSSAKERLAGLAVTWLGYVEPEKLDAELFAHADLVYGHGTALLEAAKRLGVDPARCVYVGDDERDIVAGHAANMKTVAATYGYLGVTADVQQWQAHAQIDAPLQLIPLLSV
jgi:phosphoglycolate phosphatase-like HAD superfamily hydrolase/transcriptional regulator with XRE-family HTH domain